LPSPETINTYRAGVPKNIDTLALFVPYNDFVTKHTTLLCPSNRFSTVQILSSSKDNLSNINDFVEVKNIWKKDQLELFSKVNSKIPTVLNDIFIQANTASKSLVNVKGILPVSVVRDDSNAFSGLCLINYDVKGKHRKTISKQQLVIISFIYLKNKIFNLYFFSNIISKQEFSEMIDLNNNWIDKITKYNSFNYIFPSIRDSVIYRNTKLDISFDKESIKFIDSYKQKISLWLKARLSDFFEIYNISNMNSKNVPGISEYEAQDAKAMTIKLIVDRIDKLYKSNLYEGTFNYANSILFIKVVFDTSKDKYYINTVVNNNSLEEKLEECELSTPITGSISPGSFWEKVIQNAKEYCE